MKRKHTYTHTLEKNYMEIYKQKQNLSRETPTTILILISLCPLENKYYLPFVQLIKCCLYVYYSFKARIIMQSGFYYSPQGTTYVHIVESQTGTRVTIWKPNFWNLLNCPVCIMQVLDIVYVGLGCYVSSKVKKLGRNLIDYCCPLSQNKDKI